MLAMGNLALFVVNGTVYAPTATLDFSNVSVSLREWVASSPGRWWSTRSSRDGRRAVGIPSYPVVPFTGAEPG